MLGVAMYFTHGELPFEVSDFHEERKKALGKKL